MKLEKKNHSLNYFVDYYFTSVHSNKQSIILLAAILFLPLSVNIALEII